MGLQAAAAAIAPSIKLKVARGAGGNVFTIVGDSPVKPMTPGQLSSFTDVRIPVRAGDVIGYYVQTTGDHFRSPGAGYVYNNLVGDPAPGTTPTFSGPFTGDQLDIAALLEPDADNDGFGDETQDQCSTDAATQGPCSDTAAPDTTITGEPKARTKHKQATFEFTSNEAGSSFECSLNGEPFASCTSPLKVKGKKGKNSFAVRAKDAAGNVDPTPATLDWKVKKKG